MDNRRLWIKIKHHIRMGRWFPWIETWVAFQAFYIEYIHQTQANLALHDDFHDCCLILYLKYDYNRETFKESKPQTITINTKSQGVGNIYSIFSPFRLICCCHGDLSGGVVRWKSVGWLIHAPPWCWAMWPLLTTQPRNCLTPSVLILVINITSASQQTWHLAPCITPWWQVAVHAWISGKTGLKPLIHTL